MTTADGVLLLISNDNSYKLSLPFCAYSVLLYRNAYMQPVIYTEDADGYQIRANVHLDMCSYMSYINDSLPFICEFSKTANNSMTANNIRTR